MCNFLPLGLHIEGASDESDFVGKTIASTKKKKKSPTKVDAKKTDYSFMRSKAICWLEVSDGLISRLNFAAGCNQMLTQNRSYQKK